MAVKSWRDLLTMDQRVNQLRPRGCQPAKAVKPWRDLLTMEQRVNQLRPQHHSTTCDANMEATNIATTTKNKPNKKTVINMSMTITIIEMRRR